MSIEVEIKIEEKSMRRLRNKMKQVVDDLGDAYLPNRWIGRSLLRWIDENFTSEGGKVGGWPPFKYGGRLISKKRRKRSPYFGKWFLAQSIEGHRTVDASAMLLQRSGRLRGSFWPYKATATSVTVGTAVEYSQYHEYGVPQRNLPKRRMLPRASDKEVSDMILKIYDDYIYQVTGK